jgi:hypothetical protein
MDDPERSFYIVRRQADRYLPYRLLLVLFVGHVDYAGTRTGAVVEPLFFLESNVQVSWSL